MVPVTCVKPSFVCFAFPAIFILFGCGRSSPYRDHVFTTKEFINTYEGWVQRGEVNLHDSSEIFTIVGMVASIKEWNPAASDSAVWIIINEQGQLPANDSVQVILNDSSDLPQKGQKVKIIGILVNSPNDNMPVLACKRLSRL